MVGAFPVFKLAALAAKQISRPIANSLKKKAKNSDFIRQNVCIPPGQLYHLWDTRLKFRLLGLEKPKDVKKLTDDAAAEVGAEILGECIMFSFGTILLILEYRRQSRRDADKEQKLLLQLSALEDAICELRVVSEMHGEKLTDLDNHMHPHN